MSLRFLVFAAVQALGSSFAGLIVNRSIAMSVCSLHDSDIHNVVLSSSRLKTTAVIQNRKAASERLEMLPQRAPPGTGNCPAEL